MIRKKSKFLRIGYTQYSKLGLRRKNKQVYRKGKGGNNKMRLKMKGHLRNISIGFGTDKTIKNKINGLNPVMVFNIEDLKKLKQGETPVIANVGNKRKMELCEYSIKNNIRLSNLNSNKFLEKIKEERKLKDEKKGKKLESKKEREMKAAEAEKKKEEKVEEKHEDKKLESKENKTEVKVK